MQPSKPVTQRDAMRRLLLEHGYNKSRVCADYAQADARGEIPRKSDMNAMTSEAYAEEMWKDGHRARGPWIVAFCRKHGLK